MAGNDESFADVLQVFKHLFIVPLLDVLPKCAVQSVINPDQVLNIEGHQTVADVQESCVLNSYSSPPGIPGNPLLQRVYDPLLSRLKN